jgi:hypothetical protein
VARARCPRAGAAVATTSSVSASTPADLGRGRACPWCDRSGLPPGRPKAHCLVRPAQGAAERERLPPLWAWRSPACRPHMQRPAGGCAAAGLVDASYMLSATVSRPRRANAAVAVPCRAQTGAAQPLEAGDLGYGWNWRALPGLGDGNNVEAKLLHKQAQVSSLGLGGATAGQRHRRPACGCVTVNARGRGPPPTAGCPCASSRGGSGVPEGRHWACQWASQMSMDASPCVRPVACSACRA